MPDDQTIAAGAADSPFKWFVIHLNEIIILLLIAFFLILMIRFLAANNKMGRSKRF